MDSDPNRPPLHYARPKASPRRRPLVALAPMVLALVVVMVLLWSLVWPFI